MKKQNLLIYGKYSCLSIYSFELNLENLTEEQIQDIKDQKDAMTDGEFVYWVQGTYPEVVMDSELQDEYETEYDLIELETEETL